MDEDQGSIWPMMVVIAVLIMFLAFTIAITQGYF